MNVNKTLLSSVALKKGNQNKFTKMTTTSPLGEKYKFEIDYGEQIKIINKFVNANKKTIVVQGLGFVGSAMVAALSNVYNSKKEICYNVIGVDLPDENNYW